ncbi:MAG: hypothetical protein GX221_11395 [Candidatus Riflebacteria bacterium]|nr:hypothetical protein [Candidatus Riflebacteria bacterium]
MKKTDKPLSEIMEIMNTLIRRLEKSDSSGVSVAEDENIPQEDENENSAVARLLAEGHSLDDIETAIWVLSVLSEKMHPIVNGSLRNRNKEGEMTGVMHLNPLEAIRMSREAQRHLIDLLESGEISQMHFENVLQHIEQADLRSVTKENLELIIAASKPLTGEGFNKDLYNNMSLLIQ